MHSDSNDRRFVFIEFAFARITFSCEKKRRIHRRIERRLGFRPVFDRVQFREIIDHAPHAAAGKRAPEFRRQQQRNAAARPRECERSLNKERREIHLRRESAPRSGFRGAGHPRGLAKRAVLRTE